MNSTQAFQSEPASAAAPIFATKGNLLLRLIRAAQPITRTEIATRLGIDKSTVTERVKPLIADGILREDALESTEKTKRAREIKIAD
jgi:DNA-binding MarR family transcriptional regulator